MVDIKSQMNRYIKWILYINNYFNKYPILHAILNKKTLIIAKYIYIFIFYYIISNIIKHNNKIKYEDIIIDFII